MAQAPARAAATQAREKTGFEKFRDKMFQMRNDLKIFLGSDEAVARFERVTLNAVQKNPDLLTADGRTLLLACSQCAQDHLIPDGKEAVLNIYNTNMGTKQAPKWVKCVQYLPMVRGIIKNLWETGLFTMLDGACVYDKDHFKFERGDNPKIEHIPYDGKDEPGDIKAAYFIAKLTNGEVKREVMYRRDIMKVKAASKTSGSGPWVSWEDQMAIKSVIHRIHKQLPSMPDRIEKTIENDIAISSGTEISTAMDPLADTNEGHAALPENAGGERSPVDIQGQSQRVRDEVEQVSKDKIPEKQAAAFKDEDHAGTGRKKTDGPDLNDAIALIRADDYSAATDLGRAMSPKDQETIAGMIESRRQTVAKKNGGGTEEMSME